MMRTPGLTTLTVCLLATMSATIVAAGQAKQPSTLKPRATVERIETSSGDVQLRLFGPTMGTYFSIVIDSPAVDEDGEKLLKTVQGRLADINSQMSTWDRESEISRFNAQQSRDWFAVSSEFLVVAMEAKRIHELTEGAFDPTVAPLIELWGFADTRKKSVPDAAQIKAALASTGMQHLDVQTEPPALRKNLPALQLNLSAIAKGYAVDVIAQLLTNDGLTSFVVDIGGENRTGVAKASGAAWKLGVESPLGGPLHRVMKLTESSIATSGDYRNNFEMDGVVYCHAIDPISGWPVKNPPASVSVIEESCMTADAWATAMMIIGTEKGIAIAEKNGLSVMFQTVNDGEIEEASTGLFGTPESDAETATSALGPSPNAEGSKADSAPWFPFAAAAVIFLIAVAGMAIGTILQNKSIKGSCGGLASMPGSERKSICELCTIPKDECTNAELREQMQNAARKSQTSQVDGDGSDLGSGQPEFSDDSVLH